MNKCSAGLHVELQTFIKKVVVVTRTITKAYIEKNIYSDEFNSNLVVGIK